MVDTGGADEPNHGQPDNAAAWDALAAAYDREVGWPEQELAWGIRCPPESRLDVIGDVVAGATTTVLGCGGGQDLLALHRLGAGPLTGIDPSAAQLERARERLGAAGVQARLLHGDDRRLDGLEAAHADLVVSVQALDYVADLDRCLRRIANVLRPGGVFAMSVLHPADVSTEDTPPHGWHTSYHQEERDWWWDELTEAPVLLRSWFRSPSAWFTAVTGAGLVVERMLEPAPGPPEPWLQRGWIDEASSAKLELVPSTFVLRARRTKGPAPPASG